MNILLLLFLIPFIWIELICRICSSERSHILRLYLAIRISLLIVLILGAVVCGCTCGRTCLWLNRLSWRIQVKSIICSINNTSLVLSISWAPSTTRAAQFFIYFSRRRVISNILFRYFRFIISYNLKNAEKLIFIAIELGIIPQEERVILDI